MNILKEITTFNIINNSPYNRARLHSSLSYQPPSVFATKSGGTKKGDEVKGSYIYANL